MLSTVFLTLFYLNVFRVESLFTAEDRNQYWRVWLFTNQKLTFFHRIAPWKSLYTGALCSKFLFTFGRHLCFYLLTPGSLANVPAKYARSRGCSFERGSERFGNLDFILSGFCKLPLELILFFSTSVAKLSISPQRMKSFPYSHFINSIDCLLRQYLKF